MRPARCPGSSPGPAGRLLEEQGAAFEGALWMALRALEEKAIERFGAEPTKPPSMGTRRPRRRDAAAVAHERAAAMGAGGVEAHQRLAAEHRRLAEADRLAEAQREHVRTHFPATWP